MTDLATLEPEAELEVGLETDLSKVGITYAELVWGQFRKKPSALFGLGLVGVLFLVAFLAHFLANNKPYVMIVDGRWSFPLFANFSRTDVVWFGLFVAVLTAVAGHLAFCRGRTPAARRRRRWLYWGVTAVYLAYLGWDAYFFNHFDQLTDYTAQIEQLRAQGHDVAAWFPPVAEHFRAVDTHAAWPSLHAEGHLLGVDAVGRDVLARLIHGTRVSMAVGFISVGISMVIGVVLGALAGYFRGAVDAIIMRIVEVVLCFPTIFLILMLLAFLPRSVFMVMVVIGLTSWTSATRLIRGEFFKQREMEYAMAGQALGMSPWRLMFRHILPNSIGPVLVVATFGVASAILLESVLTFLGLGAGPETPSWGEMLSQGRENTLGRWFLVVLPGLAIFVNVLAFNLVGDGLRDAIDPRLRV